MPLSTLSAAEKAWLAVEQQDGMLQLNACYQSRHEKIIRYEFNITKSGPSGRSQSSQSGQQHSKAASTTILAHSQIRLQHGDRLEASLRIFHQKKLVATANYSFP